MVRVPPLARCVGRSRQNVCCTSIGQKSRAVWRRVKKVSAFRVRNCESQIDLLRRSKETQTASMSLVLFQPLVTLDQWRGSCRRDGLEVPVYTEPIQSVL